MIRNSVLEGLTVSLLEVSQRRRESSVVDRAERLGSGLEGDVKLGVVSIEVKLDRSGGEDSTER